MKSLNVYQVSCRYVSKFLKYETFNFWEVLIFSTLQGFFAKGGVIINSEYQGRRNLPGAPKVLVTFYQVMKTSVSFLPGYQFFLTNP